MGKKEEDQGAKLVRCAVGILLGGLLALGVCMLFLLGASVAISGGLLDMVLTYQITIVGCVLGGFCGGLLAVGRCGGGLAAGLLTGGVLFLLVLTLGALCFRDVSLESGGIGLLCGSLCGGAAAGLLGNGSGKGKRKKRRKR